MPCEDEGRDQGDASISQETLKIANRPPEAGKVELLFFFSQFSERTNPADTLISDF